MKIAILGFGSLVNNPYSEINQAGLNVEKPNNTPLSPELNIREDSPFIPAVGLSLPVRLGRLSSQGTENRRITCVLHKGASNEQAFYTRSKCENLNDAIRNLREREGISQENKDSIGFVNLNTGNSRSKTEGVADKVSKWARENGFDAAIWTDLSPKGIEFELESKGREIVPLLANDTVLLENTKKYIRDLPIPPNKLQKDILAMGNDYQASLTADFRERDLMPQTNTPRERWFDSSFGTWGPFVKTLPAPNVPQGVDAVQWKRDRIVEVAKHYTGLPYKRVDGARGHFPERNCGLDCSNFVSWVYNYGLGIRFTSDVDHLIRGTSNSVNAGRQLRADEPLQKGDLLFFNTDPKHVVIYVDENHIIDSTSGCKDGVQVRDTRLPKHKWCKPSIENHLFIGARRPVE